MDITKPRAHSNPQPPTSALYTAFPVPPPPRKSSRRNTTPRIVKPPPLDLNIRNSTIHKRRSALSLNLNKAVPSAPEEANGREKRVHLYTLGACGASSVSVCRQRLYRLESMMDVNVGGLESGDRFTVFMHGG